jgi:hypothetical protein
MRVTTDELRAAANALLQHLDDTGYGVVDLDADYYWSVAPDQRYNVYEEPVDLSVGQLSDDLAEVRAIGTGEKEPIGYGLVWLSSVLRAVGERTVR